MARPAALTAAPFTSSNPARLFTAINTAQRNVLVIAPQWVGDAIVSLPLIDQLATEYDCVDVLAVPAVETVYRCTPSVRTVVVAPFAHGRLQWGIRRNLALTLRGRYSSAIVLPNSLKSALLPWLAGITVRRGMTGESRYILLNQRIDAARVGRENNADIDTAAASSSAARSTRMAHRASMLDHYLALADHPVKATDIDRFDRHRPIMAIPAKERTTTALIAGTGVTEQAACVVLEDGLLALCPGAEYGPAKQWPAEHFARLADAWIKRNANHHVVIMGGPKDVDMGNEIFRLAGQPPALFNLCGRTSLMQAFAWIASSRLVVSNDSGLMHAAAALDVPVIGIFGSSDPGHTPPLSRRARALSLHLSCSPCFQRSCPLGTTACLKELQPDRVLAEINGLLADAQSAHA